MLGARLLHLFHPQIVQISQKLALLCRIERCPLRLENSTSTSDMPRDQVLFTQQIVSVMTTGVVTPFFRAAIYGQNSCLYYYLIILIMSHFSAGVKQS